MKKFIKDGEQKVHETGLIFAWVIGLQASSGNVLMKFCNDSCHLFLMSLSLLSMIKERCWSQSLNLCWRTNWEKIVSQTDRQTDILLTEKKSHYRLICHRNESVRIVMHSNWWLCTSADLPLAAVWCIPSNHIYELCYEVQGHDKLVSAFWQISGF